MGKPDPAREQGVARSVVEFQGFRIEQLGRKARSTAEDVYHFLMSAGWVRVLAAFIGVYLAANVVFALLYLLVPGSLLHARPGHFGDAFFFSIDTMTTIGHGSFLPANLWAHFLATTEVLFGLLWVATATGVIFAKLSRPSARVQFSKSAVVCRRDGHAVLMFRIANARNTAVIEARVRVDLLITCRTAEGEVVRRLFPLQLQQAVSPMFVITWNAIHVIDEDSPLWGLDPDSLRRGAARLSVIVTGMDTALMQTVVAQHVYDSSEMLWNRCYVDVISAGSEPGMLRVDYRLFDDTRPAEDGERVCFPEGARSGFEVVEIGP